jgi:hypothetical protein
MTVDDRGKRLVPTRRSHVRRSSWAQPVLALFGVVLLALLALAALLLGGALSDATPSHGFETRSAAAVRDHEHTLPALHALHQQPVTRTRGVAFATLTALAVVAAWSSRRIRDARAGRLRTLRITGLPPGRAPPRLRIA